MSNTTGFTKVGRGWYATENGVWAVVADGYPAIKSVDAEPNTGYEGFQGGEWALVYDAQGRLREDAGVGENLDWFPTKREAIAAHEGNWGRRRITPA